MTPLPIVWFRIWGVNRKILWRRKWRSRQCRLAELVLYLLNIVCTDFETILKIYPFDFIFPESISNANWTVNTIFPVLDLLSYIRTEKLLLHTCTKWVLFSPNYQSKLLLCFQMTVVSVIQMKKQNCLGMISAEHLEKLL